LRIVCWLRLLLRGQGRLHARHCTGASGLYRSVARATWCLRAPSVALEEQAAWSICDE
jgi:hypothetical protein